MKRFVFALAAALVLMAPATALAKKGGPVYVPPSESAASQYTEDVPTAGGNTPSSHVHGAGTPGGGSDGSSRGGSAGGAVSPSTLKAMSSSGPAGSAAASLARALAPKTAKRTHRKVGAMKRLASSVPAPTTHPGSSAGQVVKTLAGSDAGSGVGALLPIILIGSLVLATIVGVARLRRPGAAS